MSRAVFWLALIVGLGAVWIGFSPSSVSRSRSSVGISTEQTTGEGYPEALSEVALSRLEQWLRRAPAPTTGRGVRDPFRAPGGPGPPAQPPETVDGSVSSPAVDLPRLTGFVYRPSGPVAAIQYLGRMWLVEVGDYVGSYRVEKLAAAEEVYLIDTESGDGRVLLLR